MDDRQLGFDTASAPGSVQRLLNMKMSNMIIKTQQDVPEFPMLVFDPKIGRSRAKTKNGASQMTWRGWRG
jgi:hypothetical protein